MTTSFPTGLDAFTNPGATDYEDGTGVYHDEQHANANDAVEALEAKVGIDGSAVPSTLDYQMENHTHTGGVLSPDVLELPADSTRTTTGDITSATAGWTDNSAVSIIKWNGASAATIHGLASPTDGKVLIVENVTGGQVLTITDSATDPTSGNRIYTPGGTAIPIGPHQGVVCVYDATNYLKWKVVGYQLHASNHQSGGADDLTSYFARLGAANTFTAGPQTLQTGGAGTIGLIVKGAASQSADLQQWQNSAGAVLSHLTNAGDFKNQAEVVAREGVATQVTLSQAGGGGAILFGTDYNAYLYNPSSGVLRTNGSLVIDGNATVGATLLIGAAADTNLYRVSAGLLAGDIHLRLDGGLRVDHGNGANPIYFGSALDTNLYRSAANVLKTDDKLHVALELELDGDLNHDGSNVGFFGVAPAPRAAAYTPTNVSADRSYDANATSVDELADVLGTLIADLQAYGLLQ